MTAHDDSRRRFLVRALGSGLLSGGLGWTQSLSAGWFGGMPGRLPEGKSIFDMKGEVRVNGRPASYETRIGAGDRISTGEGAYLVTAVGQTAFILRERSALELSGREAFIRSMQLISGAVLGVFGRRRSGEELQLGTAYATVGIRGTGVYVEADSDKSYVCTCYGTTDIASIQEPAQRLSITATHHDAAQYVLKDADGGRRIVPAPFINHADLELMTLEALVGRKVPFGLQDDGYESPRRDY